MFENMEVLGWFPWPRPWPVRWAHPTQPPWPDHRRCGPRCGSLLHPLDDKKAILIIPCHLLSMFPFVLHWFTMFYPILAPCPSHALYPCHSSTLEAPKSVASHDVTRYELPQVPWVPAKFPPGSRQAKIYSKVVRSLRTMQMWKMSSVPTSSSNGRFTILVGAGWCGWCPWPPALRQQTSSTTPWFDTQKQ